jgi:hypothetical protein
MVKRQAVEAIETQRIHMIAALYANPNWDDEKSERPKQLRELEQHFNRAVKLIYDPESGKDDEVEIDWDNPFWQAHKRAQDRIYKARPELRDKEVGEVIEMDKKQLEARRRSREEIDQL